MDLPPVLKETETRQLPQRMKKTEEKHKRSNKPRRGIVPFVTSQTDLEKRRKHYEKKTGPCSVTEHWCVLLPEMSGIVNFAACGSFGVAPIRGSLSDFISRDYSEQTNRVLNTSLVSGPSVPSL